MLGREEKISAGRLTSVQYAILVVFLVLGYGLWRLQVSQSNYYTTQAENNRVRKVPILAPRGKIIDSEGRIIVDNYPSFTALMMRDSTRDMAADAPLIAQGLHMNETEVRDKIRHFAGMPQYAPIYLKEDITPDELAFVESHRNELPELDTIMAHRRLYPRNGFLAHLVGYVGEVSEDMLSLPQWELYNPGDVVGSFEPLRATGHGFPMAPLVRDDLRGNLTDAGLLSHPVWSKVFEDVVPAEPLLVQRLDRPSDRYWIVPTVDRHGMLRGAVGVDAYFGDYQQAMAVRNADASPFGFGDSGRATVLTSTPSTKRCPALGKGTWAAKVARRRARSMTPSRKAARTTSAATAR